MKILANSLIKLMLAPPSMRWLVAMLVAIPISLSLIWVMMALLYQSPHRVIETSKPPMLNAIAVDRANRVTTAKHSALANRDRVKIKPKLRTGRVGRAGPAGRIPSDLNKADVMMATDANIKESDLAKTILMQSNITIDSHFMSLQAPSENPDIAIIPIDPIYPPMARRLGIEGSVVIEFSIQADGKITDVIFLEVAPKGYFEQTILEAVADARYLPRRRLVASNRMKKKIVFRLDD